jgi:hypothetical protein
VLAGDQINGQEDEKFPQHEAEYSQPPLINVIEQALAGQLQSRQSAAINICLCCTGGRFGL